jgi:hypothetical protein
MQRERKQCYCNKISLGKYENSVCHVASTVAVKIDYR